MIRKIIADGKAEKEFLKEIEKRNGDTDKKISAIVADIIENVKERGDEAVKEYTLKFDGKLPEYYEIPRDVINDALTEADPEFTSAVLNALENITDFHNRQKEQSFINAKPDGCILGQRVRGLERVGLYVPAGTAPLFSSVLMNAVPAKIAGVKEIIMITPPGKDGKTNPEILCAAAIAGVDRVFAAGGAQAIAAMAYGTDTIPKVDKIVGPGNIFVATAKKLLYGKVDI
ncbi:MAG: histidinol dehydrogenase, partial [Oscillospiraceae bacterium]|nr:histidinol dehydrogenase [Oscillospiraceae bacterium]